MYLVRTPRLIQSLIPNYTWSIPTDEKVMYLTFDDGPIPEVTPWVLETLKKFNAKATFFCVGDNVNKNPTIFQQVLSEGHAIGNHTFSHINGWNSDNFPRCASLCEVGEIHFISSALWSFDTQTDAISDTALRYCNVGCVEWRF
jgi:Polysaccharide deacetylase